MKYRIEYLKSVVDDDIPKLTKSVRKQVKAAIEDKLTSATSGAGHRRRNGGVGARGVRRRGGNRERAADGPTPTDRRLELPGLQSDVAANSVADVFVAAA